MTMKAGKYYVGDLAYVMHESWNEVCDLIIDSPRTIDGEFTMKDGRRFACYGTKWGDGCYTDQFGNEYGVDAGLIGCISVDEIDENLRGTDGNFGGAIIDFPEDFETSEEDGKIRIGHIVVDTDPSFEDLHDAYIEEDEY